MHRSQKALNRGASGERSGDDFLNDDESSKLHTRGLQERGLQKTRLHGYQRITEPIWLFLYLGGGCKHNKSLTTWGLEYCPLFFETSIWNDPICHRSH